MKLLAKSYVAAAVLTVAAMTTPAYSYFDSDWSNATSGLWTDATNWSTNPAYPNSTNYEASIQASGSPYTITVASPITVYNLMLNSLDATVTVSATFNSSGNSSWLEAGTLDLLPTSSAVTFNATYGLVNYATINLSPSASGSYGSTIATGNYGLTNDVGGTINFNNPADNVSGLGISGNLGNAGTLNVNQSCIFSGSLTNSGTISVAAGMSLALATLTQSAGTLDASASNASVTVTGGDFNYLGGTILGTPTLYGATIQIGAGTGPVSLCIGWKSNYATSALDSDILAGQSITFDPTGGAITVNGALSNSGTLTFAPVTTGSLFATTLSLAGTVFQNLATGTVNINNPNATIGISGITNAGAFNVNQPFSFSGTYNFTNSGSLNVNQSFTCSVNSFINTGNITVGPSGSLAVSAIGFTLAAGTVDVSAPGAQLASSAVSLDYTGGTILGAITITAGALDLGANLNPATFVFSASGASPNVAIHEDVPAGLTIMLIPTNTSFEVVTNSNFSNAGTITFGPATGTGAFSSSFYTTNSFTNLNGGVINDNNPYGTITNALTLNNEGTININAICTFTNTLTNSGTITIASGQALTVAGLTLSGGTLDASAPNASITITGGLFAPATFNYNAGSILGSIILTGVNLTIAPSAGPADVIISDGVFVASTINGNILSSQSITLQPNTTTMRVAVPANFSNAGTLTFASSIGSFAESAILSTSVSGTFTNLAGGTINQNNPANGLLSLITAQTFVNAGTLNINQSGAYAGAINNTGTINIAAGQTFALSAPGITLNGGILAGYGTISGTVTAGSGTHTIAPSYGLSPSITGTLTLGSLTTNANTTLQFNLITPLKTATGGSDLINVTAVNGLTLGSGTTINVSNHSTGADSLGYYEVMQYNGTLNLGAITLPASEDSGHVVYTLSTTQNPGYVDIHRGLLGDANDDGVVDIYDLATLASNWQQAGGWSQGNFLGDSVVDIYDLAALAANWQGNISEFETAADSLSGTPLSFQQAVASIVFDSSPVPEPASLALLGMGAAALLARRRRR